MPKNNVAVNHRKHALFTLSDASCGEFLVRHWMPSLLDNVDLTDIDVIVLDYGLTDDQRMRLASRGLICYRATRDGYIGTLCLRDIAEILDQSQYDQALNVDGGDVIFQADISHLFEQDKQAFRAVCEDVDATIHRFIMPKSDFSPDKWKTMMQLLKGKPMINGSMVFAPANKYQQLWSSFAEFSSGCQEYASEQLFMNYHIHQQGFVRLPSKYNFVIVSSREKYQIKEGVFYDQTGMVIPVVHNAGGREAHRYIKNFGYGNEFNKKKILTPLVRRPLGAAARLLNRWTS